MPRHLSRHTLQPRSRAMNQMVDAAHAADLVLSFDITIHSYLTILATRPYSRYSTWCLPSSLSIQSHALHAHHKADQRGSKIIAATDSGTAPHTSCSCDSQSVLFCFLWAHHARLTQTVAAEWPKSKTAPLRQTSPYAPLRLPNHWAMLLDQGMHGEALSRGVASLEHHGR